MKIKYNKIYGNNCRYLSEIDEIKENGIPSGVINKKLADVGATFYAANCNYNYIIVCPTIDLIKSIASDENNVFPIFACYSGINEKDYKSFIETYKPNYIKIIVTYDKFNTISSWINPNDFRVLVDEYHLLLQTIDYRGSAISSLFKSLQSYNHVSFISATPINQKFEINELQNLPHYEIDWNNTDKIIPYRLNTNNVIETTKRLINAFLEEKLKPININGVKSCPKELFVFINSVVSIKKICDDLDLDPNDIKICCSSKQANIEKLSPYKISEVISKNKKINFFTSKCFQGCNLFTNSGLIIVCSDCNKKSMITDISSDLVQIAGRLRYNKKYQNEFRNTLVHVYNTSMMVENDDEFEKRMKELKKECKDLLKIQKYRPNEAGSMISRLNIENDFVVIEDGVIKYSQNKEMFFRYFHELKKSYTNGINIKRSYDKNKFETIIRQETISEQRKIFTNQLDVYAYRSYPDVLKSFYENTDNKTFYIEYPELKKCKKYFTYDDVLKFGENRQRIIDEIKFKETAIKIIDNSIKEGFMSLKEIKSIFIKKFAKLDLKTITPTANMIEKSEKFIVVPKTKRSGKQFIKGYEIKLKK